jgi:antirestriction protein ArdC
VSQIVLNSQANIRTYSESIANGFFAPEMMFAAGFYNPTKELIFVADALPTLNEVTLHELVHWAGASKRLGRIGITKSEFQSVPNSLTYDQYMSMMPTRFERETEEMIAQLGMYKVAKTLGISASYPLELQLSEYHLYYPNADMSAAEYHATQAANYLLGMIGMSSQY